jgi:hypothetical protein
MLGWYPYPKLLDRRVKIIGKKELQVVDYRYNEHTLGSIKYDFDSYAMEIGEKWKKK